MTDPLDEVLEMHAKTIEYRKERGDSDLGTYLHLRLSDGCGHMKHVKDAYGKRFGIVGIETDSAGEPAASNWEACPND